MTKSERLRKLYEAKLGKSLVSKLSDAQIKLVSKYYNSLDDTSDIDSKIFQGRNDTELHEMARTLVEEEEESEDIPEGLDDLLGSIKDEKPEPSGALALYVPDSREEDLVSEEIDERILTLLGLDDAIDLDYATYKSLLREKMMSGRMSGSEMPTEETELITDEFKRVKVNTGRFKVKKEKINFTNFTSSVGGTRKSKTSSQSASPLLTLPGTVTPADVEPEEKEEKIQGIQKFLGGVSERLEKIEKNLSDMLDIEAKDAAAEKKEVEKDRITGEKEKKRKKEDKLEGGVLGSIGKTISDKVTAPVKGFFETLINFFTQIFLGSAVQWLMKAINNPMMFFNPFIAMINGVINLLNGTLNLIFGGLVGGINIFVDLLNGGLGNLEDMINGIFGLFGEVEEKDQFDLPEVPKAEVPQIPNIPYFKPEEPKKEEATPIKGMSGGGQVEGTKTINLNIGGWKGGTNIMKPIVGMAGGGMIAMNGFAGGGPITGSSGQTITGMGPDTQLIAAQPGEIVMSKKAVQTYGANNLLSMNRNAGGTNIPTMGSVQGFQGGGMVRDVTFSAGHAPTRANYNRRIPVGADGQNVQGTQDTRTSDQYSAGGTMAGMSPTQVAEYEATMHLVDTMRRMVEGTPIAKVIKFQNIETSAGLKGVPRAVEANQGSQFVDLHFDRRMYRTNKSTGGAGKGYKGTMMGRNRSAVDRALMAQYGEHPAYDPSDYGVISGGGTILEMAAIDDVNIRPYLEEVRDRKQGPASEAMARKLLLATLNGIKGGEALKQLLMQPGVTQPSGNTMPSVSPQTPAVPQQGENETKIKRSERKLALIDRGMENVQKRSKNNTGSGAKFVIPDVGTYVDGTTAGFIPTNKYFAPDGTAIDKNEFDQRAAAAQKKLRVTIKDLKSNNTVPGSGMYIPPSAQIPAQVVTTPPQTPNVPPPSTPGQTSIVALPGGGSGPRPQNTTVATAGQKQVPSFSSRDQGNPEFIVIKSIYNIVG